MLIFPKGFYVKLIIFLFFLFLISPEIYSQGKHYPVNVSIWHNALSLNKTTKDTANFNLSLFQTNLGSIKGVGIGVAYTLVHDDLRGINFNGGITKINSRLNGFTLSGLGNIIKSGATGWEAAGLFNISEKKIKGVQTAGVFNYLIGELKGAQLSLVVNIANLNVKGAQLGNSNIVGQNLKGVQIGTTFNAVADTLEGAQIAPGNMAGEVRGVQAGVLNVSTVNHGLMLGIINVADYQYGIPVGVVNVATKNGGAEWIIYASNFTSIATGIKINAAKFVTILEAGYNEYESHDNTSWTLGARYGYDFDIGKYYKITPDIGYVQIFDSENVNSKSEFAVQGRILGQVAFSKNIRFFAGVGYSHRWDLLKAGGDINAGKFIYLAGFSLF